MALGAAWNRPQRIAELRDRIWRYLTPNASASELALDASALLQLRQSDIRALARIQFLLHPATQAFLDSLPGLVRRLTTTSTNIEELSRERIRGPIKWPATLALQSATGIPTTFVTAPNERAFDTAENRLIAFLLREIDQAARDTGWESGTAALNKTIQAHAATARHWKAHRTLAAVPPDAPSARAIAQVRAGRAHRRYEPALAVYDVHQHLLQQLDRHALRTLIESVGLVTRDDAVLFELLCTFTVIDALAATGWQTTPLRLIRGHLALTASRGTESLTLWYQTTPVQMRTSSRYLDVQRHHGFQGLGNLRPDVVIHARLASGERWLVIEAKMSPKRVSVETLARRALLDLQAYRESFEDVLEATPHPYGLGLVWGHGLHAARTSSVALCTIDNAATALNDILV